MSNTKLFTLLNIHCNVVNFFNEERRKLLFSSIYNIILNRYDKKGNLLRCENMTNVYSLDGFLVFSLLFICTCAYFHRIPRIKQALFSEKKGFWGLFYKASIIGTRLHVAVAASCLFMAIYVIIS
ncbi:hypothetical protein CHUAL_006767 [Chamberlinius hualienensis]